MKYAATVVVLVALLVPSAFAAGQARDPRVPKMQSQIRRLQATVGELVARRTLSDLEIVSLNTPVDAFPAKSNVIRCPAGKSVVGGGGAVDARDPGVAALTKSAPWDDTSWWVGGYRLPLELPVPAGGTLWGLRGYAICATLGGSAGAYESATADRMSSSARSTSAN